MCKLYSILLHVRKVLVFMIPLLFFVLLHYYDFSNDFVVICSSLLHILFCYIRFKAKYDIIFLSTF